MRNHDVRVATSAPGFVLALVVATVPLAIDPSGLQEFLPIKQAVLLCGAALVALLTALRFARANGYAGPSIGQFLSQRPGATAATASLHAAFADQGMLGSARIGWWLTVAALALALWSLIAVTPRALNPAMHLEVGWARLAAHLVVFLVAMHCTRRVRTSASRQDLDWLLGAIAVTALLMACHACLEAARADPLAWIVGKPVQESGRWRIFTTTGNPDWTAGYLAAAAPIAVWWVSRFARGAVLLWLLFLAAILPTGSRLGLAALLAGAAIHAWARWRGQCGRPVTRGWMAVLCAGLAAIALLGFLSRGDGGAAALLRWGDGHSVLARLRLWQASLHLIAARPFAGYGLDHFARVLPDGLRAVAAPLDPVARSRLPDLLTDHAHDDFLELAVETGIPGALLLLALFGLGLRAAWRTLNPRCPPVATEAADELRAPIRPAPAASAALGASLAVLFMLSLASAPLHTPATAVLFWLVLGCLAGLAPGPAPSAPQHASSTRSNRQRIASSVAITVALLAAGWTSHRAYTLLRENRQAADAAGMMAAGQVRAAERLYAAATARAPWDHESGVALASLLIAEDRPEAALRVLDRVDAWARSREGWLARAHALQLRHAPADALRVMEHATGAIPDFLRAQMLRARLAASLGRPLEARSAWQQILLSPQRSARAQRIMFQAARALVRQDFAMRGTSFRKTATAGKHPPRVAM